MGILVMVLAVALLTSTVAPYVAPGGAPVETAAATEADESECGYFDGAIALLTFFQTVDHNCLEDVETEGRTAEQVHYDLFIRGEFIRDTRERQTVEGESHANQTVGIANAEGKYAVIEARNDGKSMSAAQSDAVDAINDFYAEQQRSLWSSQDAGARETQEIHEIVNSTDGISPGSLYEHSNSNYGYKDIQFETRELELYNGDTMEVTDVMYVGCGSSCSSKEELVTYYDGNAKSEAWGLDGFDDAPYDGMYFKSPYDDKVRTLDGAAYEEALATLEENRQMAIENSRQIAEDYYANYEAGDVSVEDTMSPAEKLRNYGTDYSSTGHNLYAVGVAAEMGYATSADTAFEVEYTPADGGETRTLVGGLYAEEGAFENDTIETNTTYNTSDLGGAVTVLNQLDASTEEVQLDGEFEVTKMTDTQTGEEVESTTLQSTDFQTTDTSDLADQLDEHQEIRVIVESQSPSSAGSGGDGFGGTSTGVLIGLGAAILLLGVGAYLARD